MKAREADGTAVMPKPSHSNPRTYTLTHNDLTGDLLLSMGPHYNKKQIAGWYTQLLRDEVVAEWRCCWHMDEETAVGVEVVSPPESFSSSPASSPASPTVSNGAATSSWGIHGSSSSSSRHSGDAPGSPTASWAETAEAKIAEAAADVVADAADAAVHGSFPYPPVGHGVSPVDMLLGPEVSSSRRGGPCAMTGDEREPNGAAQMTEVEGGSRGWLGKKGARKGKLRVNGGHSDGSNNNAAANQRQSLYVDFVSCRDEGAGSDEEDGDFGGGLCGPDGAGDCTEHTLHVHFHVSGAHNALAPASFRNWVFLRELPLVLDVLRHGDRAMLEAYPELLDSHVWVHFHARESEYNRAECWGTLREAVSSTRDIARAGQVALTFPRGDILRKRQQQQRQRHRQWLWRKKQEQQGGSRLPWATLGRDKAAQAGRLPSSSAGEAAFSTGEGKATVNGDLNGKSRPNGGGYNATSTSVTGGSKRVISYVYSIDDALAGSGSDMAREAPDGTAAEFPRSPSGNTGESSDYFRNGKGWASGVDSDDEDGRPNHGYNCMYHPERVRLVMDGGSHNWRRLGATVQAHIEGREPLRTVMSVLEKAEKARQALSPK
eukprot:jgi/Mesvir1/14899/Mv26262-RA.2